MGTFDQMRDANEKLFSAFGYPSHVDDEEGVTYVSFMNLNRKIVNFAMGLGKETRANALGRADLYIAKGHEEAARHAVNVIFSATVSQPLRAWLPADSQVLAKLKDTVEGIKQEAQHQKRTAGIFSQERRAAPIPGFNVAGKRPIIAVDDDEEEEGGASSSTKPPKKSPKDVKD